MKIRIILLTVFLAATTMTFTSCGNKSKETAANQNETTVADVLSVDSVLSHTEALANQEITIEGICTHTCQHGGTKMFLMGSNDAQTIRIEAGKLGSFDSKCLNNIVRVTGILKEQRIDEDYLQAWENKLKETAKQHGKSEAGCSTEKLARGETANTNEQRIADFRDKIAKRQAEENKPYLSFYFMEASNYEIQ